MGKKRSSQAHERGYRRASPHKGEGTFQVVVGQSDLWITVREDAVAVLREAALERLNTLRGEVSAWMLLDPAFGESLVPLPVPAPGPEIVRRMCAASAVMGVGPMACVAGGVAALVAGTLVAISPECLVENGGDSMLHSTRDRVVALLPEPRKRGRIGLRIPGEEFPLSLCASSARFGHSLSLGQGDIAVVRSRDAFLADAAATAFCNMLQGPDDVAKVADRARELEGEGIDGVFAQCGGRIGIWGNMELTSL